MPLFTAAELQRCLCLGAVGGRTLAGPGSIRLDLARDSWVGSTPATEPGAAVTPAPAPRGSPGVTTGHLADGGAAGSAALEIVRAFPIREALLRAVQVHL